MICILYIESAEERAFRREEELHQANLKAIQRGGNTQAPIMSSGNGNGGISASISAGFGGVL